MTNAQKTYKNSLEQEFMLIYNKQVEKGIVNDCPANPKIVISGEDGSYLVNVKQFVKIGMKNAF